MKRRENVGQRAIFDSTHIINKTQNLSLLCHRINFIVVELYIREMVNDIINDQPTCALFFVKPPTCAALANCVEPAIWCWHESCPYGKLNFQCTNLQSMVW